jgi:iron complex outermembrane recepter protein
MNRRAHDRSREDRTPLRFVLLPALVLAGAVAFGPAAPPLRAQDSVEPNAASPAAPEKKAEEKKAEEKKLPAVGESIVVTARKREENLEEVPVAVSVVSGDDLEESAASNIADIQADVPNLSIYAGRNQSTTLTAFMRGIGQADPLWGVDPGVGLYLDDVYIARPQGALLDVFDVQRIEVLRGPQGTLYGKNTIGGAIKYVSKPLTDQPEGRVSVSPGSYDNRDVRASLGGPLIAGKLRGKIAVASLHHDGYGNNLFTGQEVSDRDTKALRVALEWLPSETVTVDFTYDRTQDDAAPKGLTRLAANPFCPLFLGATCPPLDHHFDTQSGIDPANGTDSDGYAMTLQWLMNPAWRFKSITAYRSSNTENNIDFDTTPAPITDVFATYFDRQSSQEFQFLYDHGGRLSGVLGLYYFDGRAGGLVKNNFLNSIFGTTEGNVKTESSAVYGEGNYALTKKLTFNFGLRATDEKKTGRAFNAGYTDATFSTITVVTSDFDKSKNFNSLAPKLGLDYQFTDDVMGYVTASRGFKSGGYNVRAQASIFPESGEPFKDEVLTVGEVGVKSVLDDHHLVLNAAAFYGDYTDIQVSTFTSYDSNGDGVDDAFFGNFLNAGDATIKGVEVEYDWTSKAASWFGVSGNVSYLDAKPTSFLDQNHDGFVDTQVITNAPEFTGTLRLNFHHAAFGGLLTASAGVSHRDESVLTNEGGPDPRNPTRPLLPISQPAYELYDAWIGWLSPAAKWRIGVAGKNLANEGYLTNGYNIPVLGILQGSYGDPRTVLATLEFRLF